MFGSDEMGAAVHWGLGLGVGKASVGAGLASVTGATGVGVNAAVGWLGAVGEATAVTVASVALASGEEVAGPQAVNNRTIPTMASTTQCRFIIKPSDLSSTKTYTLPHRIS